MSYGAKSAIANTAVQVTAGSNPVKYGTSLRADVSNAVTVYVGNASTVTAGTADATDGFPLRPGEQVFLPTFFASDVTGLYVIAPSGTTARVFWETDSVQAASVDIPGPTQWSKTHTPATTAQATISQAAGAAGVKHVCTSLSFCYSAGASAITAAAPLLVNLRDGATGAGTILWSSYVNLPATAAQSTLFSLSGLNVVGTAATAMTLEFSATSGTNSYQSVAMTGYSL